MKRFVLALGMAAALGFSSVADAGHIRGPQIDVARCQARGSVSYVETFRGGELAVASIVGDGDTDLDIYVYDEFGNLIVSGIGLTDRETVTWTPRFTGPFRIVVRNLGGVWNQYTLRTN